MYTVMGITGQVGSAVANTLLSLGQRVRAVVRNPSKASAWRERGVELVTAEFNDAAALENAFRGAKGVFAMVPPNFAPSPDLREPREFIGAIAEALQRARPERVVYLSSIGAQQPSGLGLITSLHLFEEAIHALPLPSAALRAGWFMENCAWDIEPARKEGRFYSHLQPLERTFPLVATRDIGRIGAEMLMQEWQGQRHIEIEGPRRYSPTEIAAALARAIGRDVQAVAVPRSEWASTFVAQGTPADRTALRVEMLDGFNSGWIDFGVPSTEHVTGATGLNTVLRSLSAPHEVTGCRTAP